MPPLRTIVELTADLKGLGVSYGGVVMVHASMRALGPVERRAEGVVEALDASVGPEGTLLMVLGAHDDWAWVNDRPEAERAPLLAEAVPFDCRVTPAEEDLGVLAEVFRTTPGTVVSDHPEGRFGARGRRARELVDDVPWDDYYGPGSPLERLVQADGQVVRLGADPNTITLTHYAEYLAALPHKRRVRRARLVAAAGGPEIRTIECLDDANGIVEYAGEDYFGVILEDYARQGGVRRGRVANAIGEIIQARPFADFAARWMEAHLHR